MSIRSVCDRMARRDAIVECGSEFAEVCGIAVDSRSRAMIGLALIRSGKAAIHVCHAFQGGTEWRSGGAGSRRNWRWFPRWRSRWWPSPALSAGRSTCRSPLSRRFPDYAIEPGKWSRQYVRLFGDAAWATSLRNIVILALGSALAIVLGFVLAAMIEKEQRGEGFFRTIFLYPLAVSLIVTGIIWRWMFNPAARRPEFPASARMGERRVQLARRSGAPPCTASSSPRSGTGSASTWR